MYDPSFWEKKNKKFLCKKSKRIKEKLVKVFQTTEFVFQFIEWLFYLILQSVSERSFRKHEMTLVLTEKSPFLTSDKNSLVAGGHFELKTKKKLMWKTAPLRFVISFKQQIVFSLYLIRNQVTSFSTLSIRWYWPIRTKISVSAAALHLSSFNNVVVVVVVLF